MNLPEVLNLECKACAVKGIDVMPVRVIYVEKTNVFFRYDTSLCRSCYDVGVYSPVNSELVAK